MCDGMREMTRQELVDMINELMTLDANIQTENEKLNSRICNLKEMNEQLREDLKNLKEKYEKPCEGGSCQECTGCEDDGLDLESLVYELEYQHQQDCIRYNDMRTAFLKTVDELAMLRKQFGVGQ